jgi:hypothetical protein
MYDLNEQLYPGNSEDTRTGWDRLAVAVQKMQKNRKLWLSAIQRRDMDAIFWCERTQFWIRQVNCDLCGYSREYWQWRFCSD